MTFFYKFVFSTMWISTFGAGTAGLWLGTMHDTAGASAPAGMKWIFLAIWIAGTSMILALTAGLKKVSLSGDWLIVSNFSKEARIPLNMVESVSENRWINSHPVTIHFHSPTEFGTQVTFMPKVRIWAWSSHPVVAELRKAANLPVD